jgi:putative transcriptional regulator
LTPRHHPSEDLLVDFATGALAHGARMVIAAHLGACSICSVAVAEAEAIGGALLSALPPTPLKDHALALALAQIERPPAASRPPLALTFEKDWIFVPREVLEAAQQRRRWAAPGVWVAKIGAGPDKARHYLLGVAAGMHVPRHTHRGREMVCVLQGAYRDGERLHMPGDFACNDETVDHRPQITADGDCVCLISADGRLVPRDWMGRIFQPLVSI